jgi:hypothetical protein
MHEIDYRCVDNFLASPRHCHHFLVEEKPYSKVITKFQEIVEHGGKVKRKPDQGIIINIEPNFVEVHDGNASLVAWVWYRRLRDESVLWKDLYRVCEPPPKAILYKRMNTDTQEYWHPYVPGELKCASLLKKAPYQDEKGKHNYLAVSSESLEPIYFNNTHYFNGVDRSETIGTIAEKFIQRYPDMSALQH